MTNNSNPESGRRTWPERLFANELRAWRGEADLSRVFWIQGVLTSAVLMMLYATTIYLEQRIAEQLLLIVVVFYSIWILVSIWRCAAASSTFWAMLARFLTVAWALNTAMILLFREMELLAIFTSKAGLVPF